MVVAGGLVALGHQREPQAKAKPAGSEGQGGRVERRDLGNRRSGGLDATLAAEGKRAQRQATLHMGRRMQGEPPQRRHAPECLCSVAA